MFSVVRKMNESLGVGYLYFVLGILMVIGGLYITKSTSEFVGTGVCQTSCRDHYVMHSPL
ncbi:hypothetical protein I6F53_19985 [Pseudoalteromonas sp. SWN29]|uniref:hypothetical protein n=1 Tax=Pseudoalteromonas sp. SWN29 TaxID=2792064 RepID=UPI0018CC8024|nr:hypothetical protein [Pseudoalteromonas sp. SWN29]MBH0029235.1 hypothetical protein [Pseudoalteromonas sp. SWN29]